MGTRSGAAWHPRSPAPGGFQALADREAIHRAGLTPLREIMREATAAAAPPSPSIPDDATLSQAAALMAYEGVPQLAVVTRSGEVVGQVSALDVARWLAEQDGYILPRAGRAPLAPGAHGAAHEGR